jgi:hypothetical protein
VVQVQEDNVVTKRRSANEDDALTRLSGGRKLIDIVTESKGVHLEVERCTAALSPQ